MCNFAEPIHEQETPQCSRANPRFRAFLGVVMPRFTPSDRRRFVSRLSFLLSMAAGLLLLGASPAAWAQVTFNGVVSTLNTGSITLGNPAGVAVDPAGNVYIVERSKTQIVKVNPQGAASLLTISGVGSGLNGPSGLALDGAGNLYIADTGNNRIVKVSPSGSGSVVSTGSVSLQSPVGIAVDASGNIFISDQTSPSGRIVEVSSGGSVSVLSITVSPSPTTLAAPAGLAVDTSGNLYIADSGNDRIVTVAAGGTAGSVLSISGLSTGLANPQDVAIDGLGNVYIADSSNSRVVVVAPGGAGSVLGTGAMSLSTPVGVAVDVSGTVYIADAGIDQIVKVAASAVGFGHPTLGTSSSVTQALPFSVANGTTVGSVKAFTLGAPNLDFTVVPSGTTCTNGTTDTTCNVNLQFLPTAPGLRRGAVVLYDNADPPNPLATVPLNGFADAPVAALAPNTASVIGTGSVTLIAPYQIALDGAGNMYIANYGAQNVPKVAMAGSGASVVNTGSETLSNVGGVALDGAGNLFIADYGNGRIVVVTPAGVASALSVSGLSPALNDPSALAFDAAGILYIADSANGRIVKVSSLVVGSTSTGTGSAVRTGGYTLGPEVPGVAVDAAGAIYIADATNNRIVKVTATGAASSVTASGLTLNSPQGVAVDGMSNLYIADSGNARIVEVTTAGVASVVNAPGLTNPSTLSGPAGVTVDPFGNIYVPDTSNNRIVDVPVAGAVLTFASTIVGSISSDSPQTATVTNLGNQPLVIEANPTYTLSFSQNTADTNLCASFNSLLAGAVCDVSVEFTPRSVGNLSTNITVATNSLNVGISTQQISVSGKANPASVFLAGPVVQPAQVTFGRTGSVVMTVTGPYTTIALPSGTLSYSILNASSASVASGTVSLTAGSTSSTAAVPVPITLAPGSYTVSVTYGGDSNYLATSTPTTVSLTVNKASPKVSVVFSLNPVLMLNPVTLTATVSSPAGTPTGTVSFYDGQTLISLPTSTPPVSAFSLVQGVTALTPSTTCPTSAPPPATSTTCIVGTHSISAVYSGDSNCAGVTSATVPLTVEDFTLSVNAIAGVTTPTVLPGGSLTFVLPVDPTSGLNFPSAVTFAISGLPAGATATFTPATLPAGSAGTNVSLVIQIANQILARHPANPLGRGLALAMVGGMFLLPLGGKLRRPAGKAGRFLCLLFLVLAAACATLGLTSCGGTSSGYFGQQERSYTVTITATSGALSHTTTVNFIME